jgi:HEPN domain-containing protein
MNKVRITELSVKGLMRELIDKNPWIPAKLTKLFKKIKKRDIDHPHHLPNAGNSIRKILVTLDSISG